MIRSLERQLRDTLHVDSAERIVIGVSGGPDSIALLHMLVDLNRERGWRLALHVAHLNHRLRGEEADLDAAFIERVAREWGVGVTIESRDIATLSGAHGMGVEETARLERYLFFQRVCLKTGSPFVATAHHADDQVETIVHRLVRGTGIRGLAGIPPIRRLFPNSDVHLIRPLLPFTRDEIRAYLRDRSIEFRVDASNESDRHTRNRIRNALLPIIEGQFNPEFRRSMLRLSRQARSAREHFDALGQSLYRSAIVSECGDAVELSTISLMGKSYAARIEAVRCAIAALGASEKRISMQHLERVSRLLDATEAPRSVQLPHGIRAHVSSVTLSIHRKMSQKSEIRWNPQPLPIPGSVLIPELSLRVTCSTSPVEGDSVNVDSSSKTTPNARMTEIMDMDQLRTPLYLRPRRNGDRFRPIGMSGSKSVSDFLTDAKLPAKDRARIVLLCDQDGPVWIVGHRMADRVKVTSETRTTVTFTASWEHS